MTLIIDADTHVCEPPDLFTSRMPSKYGDLIPHVKYVPERDAEFWFVGDQNIFVVSLSTVFRAADGSYERRAEANSATSGMELFPTRFEQVHPSSYDPTERVKVMDEFGIAAATTYPNLGLVNPDVYRSGSLHDTTYQRAVVQAYNDWVLSWAIEQPGRFIPLGNVPYWDIDFAVGEIVRCANMGIKGLVMSGAPEKHDCPSLSDPHWDPVWAAAQDASLSISFHAGGGGTRDEYHTRIMGAGALQAWGTVLSFFGNAISAVDLLFSGVLQKFPRLNFAIVESGVGWIPFALEAADQHYKRYQPWKSRAEMKADELPSDLFRRQMFVNCWFERLQDQSRATLPVDNLMFETDYPHPTCLMGEEITEAIETNMVTLSAEEREKVLFKNALRCFNLTEKDLRLGVEAQS